DRLDALEAVFPRHHQTERRAVLVGQAAAIHTHREKRQWVHRLIHAQTFNVRPVDQRKIGADPWHLLGAKQRFEADVTRAGAWLDTLYQAGKRDPDPGNDHRPRLDTAQTIDTFFQLFGTDQVFQRIATGVSDVAIHVN